MLFAGLALIVNGCSFSQASGPVFTAPETPPSGQALIYLYRPHNESMGYNRTYAVYLNGRRLQDMEHGGYYSCAVQPGWVTMTTDGTMANNFVVNAVPQAIEIASVPAATVQFKTVAGHVYYVRLHPETHFTYFQAKLLLMPEDQGLEEIKSCKLVKD